MLSLDEERTMSLHTTPTPSVAESYVHGDKYITIGQPLTLGGTRLKWYDVAVRDRGVDPEIAAMARKHLEQMTATGALNLKGDLGFVVLHRCGPEFYFLILNTWANENEIWEQVFAKENAAAKAFALFPRQGPQLPTFCIWELGAVLHEQQAWRRYLYSKRDEPAKRAYLADQYEGLV
jgi:hypothetical protein